MTRKQLIKAIDENKDAWSCPEYACDMPEEEGNTGECCLRCAEKQLKAYEDKIKADAINEYENKLLCLVSNNCKFIVTKDCTYFAMEQEDIDKLIYETADELKEQNK